MENIACSYMCDSPLLPFTLRRGLLALGGGCWSIRGAGLFIPLLAGGVGWFPGYQGGEDQRKTWEHM